MTGQVKEDILCRWGELGVFVEGGRVVLRPRLLRAEEFMPAPGTFTYLDLDGQQQTIELEAAALAFTYCQVPVVYRRADALAVRLVGADGAVTEVEGDALTPEQSAELFGRTGAIVRIEADVPPGR
jgi:hypothetical protein